MMGIRLTAGEAVESVRAKEKGDAIMLASGKRDGSVYPPKGCIVPGEDVKVDKQVTSSSRCSAKITFTLMISLKRSLSSVTWHSG